MDFGACDEVGGHQYALTLYTLAQGVEARRVLEVGAGWGWSARAFAMSLADRKPATIWSIDPRGERVIPENRDDIASLGVVWHIMESRSSDFVFGENVDVLFIDGDPDEAEQDFERFYANVKQGGLVIMDGVGIQSGPTSAVESLSRKHPFTTLPYKGSHFNLGVHRKPVTRKPKIGRYICTCNNCSFACDVDSWKAIDALVDRHVRNYNHTVNVIAGPQEIKYSKRAKA